MAEWQPLNSRFAVAPAGAPGSAVFNPYAAPTANVKLSYGPDVQVADLGKRLGAALLDWIGTDGDSARNQILLGGHCVVLPRYCLVQTLDRGS